ncbi:MAG: methionine synthase [Candidatus Omnitrophica bacterium]|nr:methionine synthase [Candidatus Omnitrophota bacterium]
MTCAGEKRFERIPNTVSREQIYRRLGQTKNTVLTAEITHKTGQYLDQALGIIRLRGVYRRLKITEKDAQSVRLAQGGEIRSHSLAVFLEQCEEVLLMAATAGNQIVECIQEATRTGDLSRAAVYDAAASESVDTALDWLTNYFRYELQRENKQLTRLRFSPGYGDLELSVQRMMYELLPLSEFGIRLTEKDMLQPEKSVTAVAGIREIL